jgi:uncharacterized protein (DUF433 family)
MATDQWAEQLIEEVAKERRVPGIVFVDGGRGRVPRIGGTGLEVFEIIQEYLGMGRSWERLVVGFDWLKPEQLRAALAYYEAFPDEVNARIEREREVERRLGAPTDT